MFFLDPQQHNVLTQKLGPQKRIQKSFQIQKSVDMKTIINPKSHG
jgi:hypothetical protein